MYYYCACVMREIKTDVHHTEHCRIVVERDDEYDVSVAQLFGSSAVALISTQLRSIEPWMTVVCSSVIDTILAALSTTMSIPAPITIAERQRTRREHDHGCSTFR